MTVFLLLLSTSAFAAEPLPLPSFTFGVEQGQNPQDVAVTLQIILFITILSLAPAILVLMTSFTRILIVFSFLRTAMGTQQMPPNQVLIGLTLFLTFFIMTPVFNQVYEEGLAPYFNEEITFNEMYERVRKPIREFMLYNTRREDVRVFLDISGTERPKTVDDIPDSVLLPSFVVSELQTAFQMGFMLYLPFLIIDFVVASVLLSMGMMMLPPIMISVPFKILLFVLVDGWGLIVTSLVKSFL
ncbi:flagellar type III secretion system pore protein FliP [Limisalsivibrio acetivorans]|uniref:flagellar type III secretion system pore protein FliP n=1 Tax=Limisalsivibrio acetivorans TaxID=1304888 RepID=UPI00047D8802